MDVSADMRELSAGVDRTDAAASQVRQAASVVVSRADYLRTTVEEFLREVAAA
jgi:hypothetical protein